MSENPAAAAASYRPFPSLGEFITTTVDQSAFESVAAGFVEIKNTVDADALRRAVDTATRWAAVDTGAIEGLYTVDRGFTLSIAASAAALDNAHLVVGEDVAGFIKDAVAGYDFVLDVATRERDASEHWVKELHSVLCASQETHRVLRDQGPEDRPLVKGVYKEIPNSPVNLETGIVHAYASPLETAAEMARLVNELRSDTFAATHPVVQASYAHYAFVCVHPFSDGNGRVARALASTYLYRAPGVPLVVFADQKGGYIDALEAADEGQYAPLVAFIRDRATDTMLMVEADMQRLPRPDPKARIAELNRMLRSDSGLTHAEMDQLVHRLRTAWTEALDRAVRDLEAPISHEKVTITGAYALWDGYRVIDNQRSRLRILSAAPASARCERTYSVQIARPGTGEAGYSIVEHAGDARERDVKVCDVYVRDLHPTVNPALTYRLDATAEDAVRAMVDNVVTAGERVLRDAGYIN